MIYFLTLRAWKNRIICYRVEKCIVMFTETLTYLSVSLGQNTRLAEKGRLTQRRGRDIFLW